MSSIGPWFAARIAEPSTWAGLALLVQGIGQSIQTRDLGAFAQSVAGAIAVIMPENSVARAAIGK
jgi:hypothetical protein